MRKLIAFLFLLIVLLTFCFKVLAQDITQTQVPNNLSDTIILLTGKKIGGTVLNINEDRIHYQTFIDKKKKNHSINPERVFSVTKSDGSEVVVFKPDTLDPNEFSVSQLRVFIKGEQAARIGYSDNLNKVMAFLVGAGSSYFTIYGIVGPGIYSSIVGSYSPDINQQHAADSAMINNTDYREGYLRVCRDKKIRNSFVAGMIGFAVGFTAQSIMGNQLKR